MFATDSFWQTDANFAAKQPQSGLPQQADAVVVGAGITGILCSYFLLKSGVKNVVLIDAAKVMGATSAHSTAKITPQHGLLYAKLKKHYGLQFARDYADANMRALEQYKTLVSELKIDCDFATCDTALYTTKSAKYAALKNEYAACAELKMPVRLEQGADVRYKELPFKAHAALYYTGAAIFNPVKFAMHMLKQLQNMGCEIYEHTPATSIRQNCVVTPHGTVHAKNIVLCTHYPLLNKTKLLFAKIYQSRSSLLKLSGAQNLAAAYLDVEQSGHTLRPLTWPPQQGGDIIFGGAAHTTGTRAGKNATARLEKSAAALYPTAKIVARTAAQDCITLDGVPYIGELSGGVYVATGYNKWGFTSAMAAAEIIAGAINGGAPAYTYVFSPRRFNFMACTKTLVAHGFRSALNIAAGLLFANKTHGVVARCTHMGGNLCMCEQQCFECKSHGSRFNSSGQVLDGPAAKPLTRLK